MSCSGVDGNQLSPLPPIQNNACGVSQTASGSSPGLHLSTGTNKVQLRFLIIANDAQDFGLTDFQTVLNRMGAPYEILLASQTPLTQDLLVRSDGVGKYNAILLTNHTLRIPNTCDSYFDTKEWHLLWDYERLYKVRQVSLYTSPVAYPEDYCIRASSEGSVGAEGLDARLTTAGASIFSELNPQAIIPIRNSYVYQTTVASSCTNASATPILTVGNDAVGIMGKTSDGRERLALTFTSNVNLLQSTLLNYSLIRWASRGLYLGEYKHHINIDVDDWYNRNAERNPDGSFVTGGYRLTAADALNTYELQYKLRTQFPKVLPSFLLNLAYNAYYADLSAPSFGTNPGNCNTNQSSSDAFTSITYCYANEFRFINHTYKHIQLNDPGLATPEVVRSEIRDNLQIGQKLGLTLTDTTVLKTGEYSGLGVYNSDPKNIINPPDINDIMRSNPNLLSEAKAAGIKYLHGGMSFAAHKPSCFNCGKYHPMEPSLFIVPDWPTNIAVFATTDAEQQSAYNCYFGPSGTCAGGSLRFWPKDLTYDEIVEAESKLAFEQHVATGSAYTHTFHVANLRQYAPGKNLLFDWLNLVIAKYANYFQVPLNNPPWEKLGQYVAWRSAHFALLPSVEAVWDQTANSVNITSPINGSVFVTGVSGGDGPAEVYNSTAISHAALQAGRARALQVTGLVQ